MKEIDFDFFGDMILKMSLILRKESAETLLRGFHLMERSEAIQEKYGECI